MLGSIRVGHAQDETGLTGCTVFLPPEGTVGAVEVRGGAPGTRDTELLRPTFTAGGPNAILLSGGSAFGIAAASGVAEYLEKRGEGFPTPGGPVPIVSAAVIFDLDFGDARARPDAAMGLEACEKAIVDDEREGNVGVGMGATVGNVLGRANSTKSGFGLYRFMGGDFRLDVAAVANAFGEVVDSAGNVIAGVRKDGKYVSAEKTLVTMSGIAPGCPGMSTTLVVVATNGRFDCTQATRIAQQGHNGIARAIRPSHTRFDGDTVFVLATGEVDAPQDAVEALAAMGAAEAIRSAVIRTQAAGGLPAARDILSE
jgi:L-aminopeptidase/D-esterase-like protein